uniref:Uncharacterized protein n=1 Tax=Chenopodium quinoa TaxID=63459 RepID=A0A803MKK8_CHEQI
MGIGIPKLREDSPEDVDKYNLPIVAQVIDVREFSEVQIQTWVDGCWKTNRPIIVEKVSHSKDLFLFFCTSWEDRDNLISLGTASYKGALILFKEWIMGSNLLYMDFSETAVLIKVEGLPTEECQPQVATRVLEKIGTVIRFDHAYLDDRPHSILRDKVIIPCFKPLVPGFFYEISTEKALWVFLRRVLRGSLLLPIGALAQPRQQDRNRKRSIEGDLRENSINHPQREKKTLYSAEITVRFRSATTPLKVKGKTLKVNTSRVNLPQLACQVITLNALLISAFCNQTPSSPHTLTGSPLDLLIRTFKRSLAKHVSSLETKNPGQHSRYVPSSHSTLMIIFMSSPTSFPPPL